MTNLEQTKICLSEHSATLPLLSVGVRALTAISGGSTWAALYAKYFVLVVCYVNVFLFVIYDKKAVVLAQLQDAVARGLHPFSKDGMVFYSTLRTGRAGTQPENTT